MGSIRFTVQTTKSMERSGHQDPPITSTWVRMLRQPKPSIERQHHPNIQGRTKEAAMRILSVPLTLSLLLCLSPLMVARKAHTPEPRCGDAWQLPEAVQAALKKTPDVALSCLGKPSVI